MVSALLAASSRTKISSTQCGWRSNRARSFWNTQQKRSVTCARSARAQLAFHSTKRQRLGTSIFRGTTVRDFADHNLGEPPIRIPQSAIRNSKFLTHPIFNTHDTETEMLRYLKKLESRDLSLTTSMIPLGSCTMKLNATAEMFPISWPEISKLHPFAPPDQTSGYKE